MLEAYISAVEYNLPENVLTNEELARRFTDWTASKIEDKTGIRERHIAGLKETAGDLGVDAARKLFAAGKASPAEIDFVLLCTQSPDYFLPTTACIVQDRLGIPRTAGALDYNLGCSGFVYGLAIAKGLVETGAASTVLLITADTYSKMIDPGDRGVSTLFGDGAAATLVRGREASAPGQPCLGPFDFGTDGSGASLLIAERGAFRRKDCSTSDALNAEAPVIHMDGPGIFSFALKAVPATVGRLLAKSSLRLEQVDLFVFHQANSFMLESLRKLLKISPERFVLDLADKGNTVSSTIPIALLEAYRAGRISAASRIGLSWASAFVTIPGTL
jgi:3-oxoacyl-[acyl-carrier-protein] synthase-3